MTVHDNIRLLREMRQWSQEEMANRLNMSLNGYARIERGESKLHLDKLSQIAQVLNIDVIELMTAHEKGVVFFVQDNGDYACANYFSTVNLPNQNNQEIEKLQLIIQHKDEIIAQKDTELLLLKKLVAVLESNQIEK